MQFAKTIVVVGALMAVAPVAGAEDATPGRTTVKVVTVVGNPRRPSVTIEVTKQKLNIPLHEMKHPLDEKAVTSSGPF